MKRVRFDLGPEIEPGREVLTEPEHFGHATVVEILKESHPWLQDELGTL